MKKRLIVLGVTLALVLSLGGMAAAAGGTSADPLISRDYLEGTFFSEISNQLTEWIGQLMKSGYEKAEGRLERLAAGYLSRLGAADESVLPTGWNSTETFAAGGGERNDTVSISAGSSIVWDSGSAIADQALIDVTKGAEVRAGAILTEGHRYISTEQTVITVTSRAAYWAVEGVWHTTSDGVNLVELDFVDVPENSWYYDAVYYVSVNNLFNGTSETTFSPMMTMQRGMLTTVLHRMAGSPEVEYSKVFSDVPNGTWYTNGTIWAGQNGVVSGTGDGTFRPGDNVARQQIAVILYNYANMLGENTAQRGNLTAFSDSGSVAGWAKDAVSWAVSVGILRGSEGRVMPANSASRAEVAIMLQRFQDWLNKE